MYLSRLELDGQRARNPYEVHRLLWSTFPAMPDAERPFLFRVETEAPARRLSVLMQSSIAPRQPDVLAGVAVTGIRPFDPQLTQGRILRFALCANPVKRLSEERCRVPYIREEERVGWLERKIGSAAELLECHVSTVRHLNFRKGPGGAPGKIVAVTFEGILQVESPEQLHQLIRTGIGPAKSFGCGMLSLAAA